MVSQKITSFWIGGNREAANRIEHSINNVQDKFLSIEMYCTIQEAAQKVSAAKIGLIFIEVDALLPGDQCWDAFTLIAQSYPVIVVTGGEDHDFVLSALRKGACDFISFADSNPDSLLKSFRHAISIFSLKNELIAAKKSSAVLKEQFLASQKMESVGRLALGVAHDFNNLLTVILNYSQMITSTANENDGLRRKMDAITSCAQRAASITSQFLAFGRRNRPKPQAVSLTSMFSIIDPLLRQTLGSEVDLKISEEEAGLQVFIDPNHLMHVLMSIAQNSHESMPKGGSITITTSGVFVDDQKSESLGGISSGEYVVISVKDTGRGYDADTVEHIFELFGGPNKDSNAPASLSAVNSIIKHSGGHILVESEISKGSHFEIYLPKFAQEIQLEAAQKTASPEVKLAEKILVVDDEEMVRKIAVDVMLNYGFRVVEASNAIEALKICEQSPEPIDLVLTDLIMPKMNGPELVSKIINKNPHLRVVYMSGYADDAFEHNSSLETKELFVQKPFMPKSLINAVKSALASSPSLSK